MTEDVKPDFSGWATRNNLLCADGRTILQGAFAHQNGERVPLVWGHGHEDPTKVLGHVFLENVAEGVRAHAYFNATAAGQHAKEMVKHGDVRWLSIFANQLKEKAKQVSHGIIREVSLVLAGANPGATIDNVPVVAHGYDDEDVYYDEASITTGMDIELPREAALAHADTSKTTTKDTTPADNNSGGSGKSLEDILATLDDEQANAVDFLLSQALTHSEEGDVKHSDTDVDGDAGTGDAEGAEDNSSSEGESEAEGSEGTAEGENAEGTDNAEDTEGDGNAASEGSEGTDNAEGTEGDDNAAEGSEGTDNAEGAEGTESAEGSEGDNAEGNTDAGGSVQHDNISQEDNSMTHNVFDKSATGSTIAHNQVKLDPETVRGIIEHADEVGSLKKAFKSFMKDTGITVDGELKHGIENIDYLFPDAKLLDASPQFLSRRMEWVDKVLSGVRKQPFGRIKSVTADITMEEARAKGYIKGNMKKEEFFKLSKRETTPQTIYKKQALDRDDVIDIVDLDVVAWMKAEMKVMLDEAIAEAILFGDGRSNGDEDKIREDKIRPIAGDDELYAVTVNVNLDDSNSSIEEFVDVVIDSRPLYKGTGTPTFYTTEATISKFLKQKDGFGRRIYDDVTDVQKVLRVAEVVPVEAMERVSDLLGIMVNLVDYTIGTDRLGQATMFDDFDIDYNKLKYLIETRLSGALSKLKSALVFRSVPAASVLRVPTAPTFDGTTVTVPTVTGVVYKDGSGATLTTASPVALAPGQQLHVEATPGTNSYFENNVEGEWDYVGEEV